MVVDRASQSLQHRQFGDLPSCINSDDLFVLNNTRVIPARLFAHRPGREESIEVLLLREVEPDVWETLLRPGRKAKIGERLVFYPGEFEARVLESPQTTVRRLKFEYSKDFWTWIQILGKIPLPPYIDREPEPQDQERYQTVYARIFGSVAAPTAGLHFTTRLLSQIPHCEVTLQVGYGTFKPISSETFQEHLMEKEYYEIGSDSAAQISEQLEKNKRILAVGTTTTRVLEHLYSKHQCVIPDSGWTNLFIYPEFRFNVISGLLTNFHLPKSTLLLLVSAFAGKGLIDMCYKEAIREKYRFYSYGDAMLIL